MRNDKIERRYEGDVCDAVMCRIREKNIKMRPRVFFLGRKILTRSFLALAIFAMLAVLADILSYFCSHAHLAMF